MSSHPTDPSSAGPTLETRPGRPRQGRRPGPSNTRQVILEAARARFAAEGYGSATVRKIAADANVDASLVMQQFGSKDDLFAAVMSVTPSALSRMTEAFEGPSESCGERVTRAYLEVWEGAPEDSEPLLAMLRSAVGNDKSSAQIRDFVQARLAKALGPERAEDHDLTVRMGTAASVLIGVIVGRRIVKVPALADQDVEDLIGLLAPAIQAILVQNPAPHGSPTA